MVHTHDRQMHGAHTHSGTTGESPSLSLSLSLSLCVCVCVCDDHPGSYIIKSIEEDPFCVRLLFAVFTALHLLFNYL